MAKTKTKSKTPKLVFDTCVSANGIKGSVATQTQVKALNKMYKGPKGRNKRNKEPKSSKGDPVDVVSGQVYREALDLALPGLIRVEWKRYYTSGAATESSPLGKGGWTHSFHQWIEPQGESTVLRDASGGEIDFPSLEPRGTAVLRGQRLVVKRGADRSYVVFDIRTELYREFSPLGAGTRCMLRSIRDAHENRVDLHYEGERLVRITAPGKREIRVAHDAKGRVVRLESWGRQTQQQQVTYAYSQTGELASATDEVGGRETFAYDGLHRMIKATRKNGLTFQYRYDPTTGRVAKTWGDGGLHSVEFTYDLTERTTTTHGESAPRIYAWDAKGNVLREATLDGQFVEESTYDEDGLVLSHTNAAGETSSYEYDARGNCVKQTDPAGNDVLLEFVDDRPVRCVDKYRGERRYAYDGHGKLVGVQTAAGGSETLTYDGYGRPTGVYGPDGPIVTYDYDDEHNRIAVTDARGATTRYTFDPLGYPVTMTDPLGRTWRAEYDGRRRCVGMTYPDGTRATRKFNSSDNIVEHTTPLGQVIRRDYTASGMLSGITLPDGQSWSMTYDRYERLIRVKNPKAEVYEFAYDARDRVVEETAFDGCVYKFAYSRTDRLARIEYPDGMWRTFQYDPLGYVLQEQTPHGPVTFERDSVGRVLAASLEEGGLRFEVKRKYDSFGRLIEEEQNGETIRFEYDQRGRKVRRILPGGETTRYEYQVGGVVKTLDHDGVRLDIDVDVTGRETRVHLPKSGVEVRTAWDINDHPVESTATAPPTPGQAIRTILAHRTHTYDARGRLQTSTDARWGTARFEYDDHNQLVEEAWANQRVFFEYDANRSLQEILGDLSKPRSPWSIDAGGVLRRTPEAEYEYDANHNRKRKAELADWKPTGKATEYTWDARQQLREMRMPDGTRVRFFYDAFGRRVRKEVRPPVSVAALAAGGELPGDRVVRFLWDGNMICQEMNSERGKRVFVHYPGTFNVVFQQEQGETFLNLTDIRGVPTHLIDSKGRVAWTAQHSAWGARLKEWRDPAANFSRPVESPFRLLGHYHDDETGLSSSRTRYFDASVGRWLSPDPIGLAGGVNLYMFNASPTVWVDPSGMDPVTVAGSAPINSGNASDYGQTNGPGPNGDTDGGYLPYGGGVTTPATNVYYTSNGFPVFDPYAVAAVQMPFSGDSGADCRNAWALLRQAEADTGENPTTVPGGVRQVTTGGVDDDGNRYTWHHREDIDENGIGTLILVPSDIHRAIKHTGGDAVARNGKCDD